MKTVTVIRHVPFEDLGAFETVFRDAGYAIRYVEAGMDDLGAIDPATDILVVLGAPIGAYEEDKYPFLLDELRLLERRVSAARPTLGICLGAQLIARALGSTCLSRRPQGNRLGARGLDPGGPVDRRSRTLKTYQCCTGMATLSTFQKVRSGWRQRR